MSLPVYHTIHIRSAQLDEIQQALGIDMNLRHPVALNLKTLDNDQQREVIGVIENFFVSKNVSFKFPYPIYIVSDLDQSITNMPIARIPEELPKFFTQKDSKMNVKEMHLASKNKLLQQEVKNSDAASSEQNLSSYGAHHRQVHLLDLERQFYFAVLNRLLKGTKNG